MACRNDLEVDKVLIWNTWIPFEHEPRTSPVFSWMGSEWCFRFLYRDTDEDYHTLKLHQMSEGKISEEVKSLQNPFRVRTYMMHLTEWNEEIEPRNETVDNTDAFVWYQRQSDDRNKRESIFKLLPWLYDRPDIKFACKFYCPPFTLQLQVETDSVDKSVQVSSEIPPDVESLSSDFSHLLEKEILPDVKLECGGQLFQTHRSVLAARSKVFQAMFNNEMLESKTGAVKIQDMDVEVLKKLVKFLYSGKSDDLSEDCTADLYGAADKYDVPSLKTACTYWIVRNLTLENCVKYLILADSHSDCELKAALISFIIKTPDVFKSPEWLTYLKEHSVSAAEVLQAYVASTV